MAQIPEPTITRDDEVLIQVKCVGICGSDVHYFLHGRIGDQIVRERIILGHELAGQVVQVGPRVTKVKKGDRVAVEPGISCGQCSQCHQGKPNLCSRVIFLGTPPVDGALREFLVMPEGNVIKLPEQLSYREGALAEPLAIGVYAVGLSRFKPGQTVAVIGAGPIGLSVIFTLSG
ncbi:MAG: alcohol dehydrogenase catalytic domain-containing protein, partial [Candidatus Omnitrophica bacterium]|nr:alcohol dehydrogenase catalytic domain-containing protein [Candidatus Omnitrophota bacterium]